MSISERIVRNDLLWIAGVIAVLGVLGYWLYLDKSREWHIDAIMNGLIRANKESLIYHVPTCPQYDTVQEETLRTFETVPAAEEAGFHPSRNCLEAIGIRRLNETESDYVDDSHQTYDK
jgi:hypothetical protein